MEKWCHVPNLLILNRKMSEERRIAIRVDEAEFTKFDDLRHDARTSFQQLGITLFRVWDRMGAPNPKVFESDELPAAVVRPFPVPSGETPEQRKAREFGEWCAARFQDRKMVRTAARVLGILIEEWEDSLKIEAEAAKAPTATKKRHA